MTLTRLLQPALTAAVTAWLVGCATPQHAPSTDDEGRPTSRVVGDGPSLQRSREELANTPDAVPRDAPPSRYGNPERYEVFGETYHVMPLAAAEDFTQRGRASWYGTKFHGRRTSSGSPYDMYAMTAAHRELPLPTWVEVTNLNNGRRIVVEVNDRGPFLDTDERVIDLSYAAAVRLDMVDHGTAPVELRVVTAADSAPQPSGGEPADPLPDASIEIATPVGTRPASKKIEPLPLYLQAGVFAERNNALRVQSTAEALDAPTLIDEIESRDNRTLYRVRLGPVESIAEIDRLRSGLARDGIQSFLITP